MFHDPFLARIHLSKHRLEALADGVFAIAVTLIVLDIKVPDLTRNAPFEAVAVALRHEAPALLAFFITFMISGLFWFMHQTSFHWIARIDRGLVFINIGFLMFVSLVPFSTSMFAHFLGRPLGMMFYFGNATMIAVFLNLHWMYAKRKGLLTAEDGDALERKLFQQRIAVILLAFLLTCALTPVMWQFVGFVPAAVFIVQRKREEKALARAAAAAA